MASNQESELTRELKKSAFKKNTYRGIDMEKLLEFDLKKLTTLFRARQRRRFNHSEQSRWGKYNRFIKKLRDAKKNQKVGEKPIAIKTHLRNCVIIPEMVGSIVEVYNGKVFNPVEVKSDMIGTYLAEYSLSYKPVKHGKLGVGATRSSKFTSLK
jgi:small subunit ribosomal protein S15e